MNLSYLSEMLSPLHARLVALLCTVEGKHHQCLMGGLYKLAYFFKSEFNNDKKVLTNVVIRKVILGIPPFVTQ